MKSEDVAHSGFLQTRGVHPPTCHRPRPRSRSGARPSRIPSSNLSTTKRALRTLHESIRSYKVPSADKPTPRIWRILERTSNLFLRYMSVYVPSCPTKARFNSSLSIAFPCGVFYDGQRGIFVRARISTRVLERRMRDIESENVITMQIASIFLYNLCPVHAINLFRPSNPRGVS